MMTRTRIPGAKLERDENGSPVRDKKGRPIWNMPKPMEMVKHFKNAAKRRKYEAGEISITEATREVPVYRGFSARLFNYLINGHRRSLAGRWVG